MDFNKYIKELVRNQVQNSEHLQRTKGIIESINGNKITIKLISPIEQPSVTIENNNGLELSVGQNVTVNHWGDVSKGYISFNSFEKFGGGVGQWLPIDPNNTTEIFNDYKDHSINVFDSNNELTGYSYDGKKDFYGRMCGKHQTVNIKSKAVKLSNFYMSGSWNELNLGGLSDNTSNRCEVYDIHIDGYWNNITNDNGSFSGVYIRGLNNTTKIKSGGQFLEMSGYGNSITAGQCFSGQTLIGRNNMIKVPSDLYQTILIGDYNYYSVGEQSGTCGRHYAFGADNRLGISYGNGYENLLLGMNNEISSSLTLKRHFEHNVSVGMYNHLGAYFNDQENERYISQINLLGYGNQMNTAYAEVVSLIGCYNDIINNQNLRYSSFVGTYNDIDIDNDSSLSDTSVFGTYNHIDLASASSQLITLIGANNHLNLNKTNANQICICGTKNSVNSTEYGIGGINLFGCGNEYSNNGSTRSCSSQTIIGTSGSIMYNTNTNAANIGIAFGSGGGGNGMILSFSNDLSVLGSISSNGADYAEDWEWADRNPDNKDRRGLFVTIADDGYQIRVANKDDEILGIVSSNPSVIGGGDNFEWRGKYLKDVFGDYIYEDVQVPITTQERKLVKNEYTDDDGVHHPPEYETVEIETGEYKTEKRRVLNPDYDDTLVYTNREYRPEHCYIAHLGKVVMVDDGTSEPNGYVTSADGGIATKSEAKTRARVLQRLDENHIRVWWE